jgi:tRNA threonylcarbamoyladenosine biosynthesis protein TsaB
VKILALETSGMAGSVAALENDQLVCELALPPQQRSAQSLAPAMRQLLEQAGWQPNEVRLVAVAIGPGSFTGLRVGVTTAKAFAYAVSAEVLGVNTLAAVAELAPTDLQRVSCVLDAQRSQLYAADFVRDSGGLFTALGETQIVDREQWLDELGQRTEPFAVSGPVMKQLAARIPASIRVLAEEYWSPTASAVVRLAARNYAAGARDDLWKLVPQYYRRSAAEEKRDSQS